MDWINSHLLTLITFIPLVGVFLIVLIPKGQDGLMKWVALITTFISLFLCIPLYQGFDMTTSRIQFTELHAWIPFFNINYYFGIDGLSLPMVLLTCILCVVCIVASWRIQKGIKGYMSLFLMLQTGMLGVFCSLD